MFQYKPYSLTNDNVLEIMWTIQGLDFVNSSYKMWQYGPTTFY